MNIYVGNLSPDVTEEDLDNLFSEYGKVTSIKIVKDFHTNISKGFGFLELSQNSDAQKAITELNSKQLKGKEIVVNEARPRNNDGSGKGRDFKNRGSNRW
jgi:RNA recognition motif-containing protein